MIGTWGWDMRYLMIFTAAITASTVAGAQATADPLEACAQKTDPTARLACFDREMQRRHTTGAPAGTPAAQTPSATTAGAVAGASPPNPAAAHADENVGLEGAQLRKKLREQGVVEESHKPKPIVAQVSRALEHPDHRYTFFLDNGQVWEQVEHKPGLFVDAHESVTITPGVLGSFFLRTSKKLYLRVRRVE